MTSADRLAVRAAQPLSEPPHSITPAPQVKPAPNALSSTRAPGLQPPVALGRDQRRAASVAAEELPSVSMQSTTRSDGS